MKNKPIRIKKQSQKKTHRAHSSHSEPQVVALPERNAISILFYIKEVMADRAALILLLIIGLCVGVSTQVNWIQLKCENAPFFTSEPAYCRNNLFRILAGGPLAFFLLWITVSVLRWRNGSASLVFVTRIQMLLLPILLVPFFQNPVLKTRITNGVVLAYFLVLVIVLRKDIAKLIRAIFGKPSLRVKTSIENEMLRVEFVGRLSRDESLWISEAVTAIALQLNESRKKVVADVSKLEGYQAEFAHVFVLLLGTCASRNCTMALTGPQHLCREIRDNVTAIATNIEHP